MQKCCKPAMWWCFFTWFRRNAWLSKCNIGEGVPQAVWCRGLREIYWLDDLLMAWRLNHDIDFCTQGWWGYDNRHKSYVFVYSKPQLASPTSIYIIILTTHHPWNPQYTKILVDENEGIDEAGQENQFFRFEIQILSVYLIESFFYIHGYYFFNIPGNKRPHQTSGINIVDQTLDCKIYKYFKQSNSRAKTIGSNHSCFTISTRPT